MDNRPVYLTETGNAGPANGGTLYSVTLTAAGDTATAVLEDDAGTIVKLSAVTNTTAGHTFAGGVVYAGQLVVTLTGTTPTCTVEL